METINEKLHLKLEGAIFNDTIFSLPFSTLFLLFLAMLALTSV